MTTARRTTRRRLARAGAATLLAGAVVLTSGCGTRTPIAEIVAAEGRAPATTGVEGGVPTDPGAVAAPGAVDPGVPDPGATTDTGTAPGGTAPGAGTATTAPGAKPAAGAGAKPAAAAGGGATTQSQTCTKVLEPIRIGQVGGWTGIVGNILSPTRLAMQVWVKDINARGGIACHPVQLFQADDGSDPSRSSAAVQDLVQNKKVVALVGSQAPVSISGFAAKVNQLKIPAVGGDLINFEWNRTPYMFPQGGDLDGDVLGAIKVQADRGFKKVATIYCVEAKPCTDAVGVIDRGKDKIGIQEVYKTQVSITSTDYSAQCQAAKNAGADQLLLAIDASAISRLVRSCKALNYTPAISTSPIAVGGSVTSDKNVQELTLAVGSATAPWTEKSTPAQKRYHEAFARYAPGVTPDGASNVAWVSGELFAKALSNLGAEAAGPITSELVLKGLGTIKKDNLGGLTIPLTFKYGQDSAGPYPCWFPVLLTIKGWQAPQGNKATCL
ncbi:ABC transporter substrate-binding protein [Sporichthya polymorpha]|uniref:ABC transporter substrate-binding protein n=1 Tax=Sporichthya polymorpha TaxID=35751 RepID=UPI00039E33CE|nr:ABC transporter substrate-binding protein [Sporichthya polymorpha]